MEMTFLEAETHLFQSDNACALALFAAKWPQGFHCPRCNYSLFYRIRTRRLPLFECRRCRHQNSLIAGTIFQNSKTSLSKWFRAMYLSSRPNGICATQLAEIIDVTYKTAWLILHKLRHVMTESDNTQRLGGIVHAHVDLYGRPYNPTIYRHPHEHPLIAGTALNPEGIMKYAKIKQVSSQHLRNQSTEVFSSGMDSFIQQHVEPGLMTRKDICKQYNARRYRPLFEVCKLAKKWINFTFNGIGAKHLQAYLDEFCFRYNHDLNKQPTLTNLLTLTCSTSALTYSKLIRRNPNSEYSSKIVTAA